MTQKRDGTETELRALLDWYRAVGVDLAVSDSPIDRFTAPKAAPTPSAAPSPAPAQPGSGIPQAAPPMAATPSPLGEKGAETGAKAAMDLAQGAQDLEALRAAMEGFEGSALKLRATQLVFADGNPDADIMLIGEAPGREEDLQGKPFVGRSGQLLDRMLGAIGLDRTKVFIANTVPWRPPGNRTPTPAEIAVCLPFLYRQIELVNPKILVTMGAPATQTLLGAPVSITKVRGQWRDLLVGKLTLPTLPTFHPAYLLRQPAQKRLAWRDMLALKTASDAL